MASALVGISLAESCKRTGITHVKCLIQRLAHHKCSASLSCNNNNNNNNVIITVVLTDIMLSLTSGPLPRLCALGTLCSAPLHLVNI